MTQSIITDPDAGAAPLVVAIDGPAGSGKSTVARMVAQRFGMLYIDTGAMYRAVALRARRLGIDLTNEEALGECAREARIEFQPEEGQQRVLLDGQDVTRAIREPDIGELASIVSRAPAVRQAMVALQREMGAQGHVVMEGRDIGTVVFPDARVKVFLTASLDERARRRAGDLDAATPGEAVDLSRVQDSIEQRDRRDSEREAAPMIAAPDAVHLDSDGLTAEGVVERIAALIHACAEVNHEG